MRIFFIALILTTLVISCTLLVNIFPLAPSCMNEVLDRVISPDKKQAAVVFSRSCGATTGFSYQVSIVPIGEGPKGSGNVLIADQVTSYSDRLKPAWQGNKAISVPIPSKTRVFSKNNTVRNVRVTFQQL